MPIIIMLVSIFFYGIAAGTEQKAPLFRDLIVILDDDIETNPSKISVSIFDVQNVLQAEAAPMLVSASLWNTFIEARQEWLFRAQIAGTNEYKAMALQNAINDRINHWYGVLRGSFDDMHMRSLIGERVNEEFYVKERFAQLQESGIIPKKINANAAERMRHCVTVPYNFDAWYWFYLDTGYYLAIPKKYCIRWINSTNKAEILCAAGFNQSLAMYEIDPLEIAPRLHNDSLSPDQTIIPTFQALLQQGNCYKWSIWISGHGMRQKLEQGDRQKIVGISLERFKELCVWFNTHVSMHMLYVVSCHAGGIHRVFLSDAGSVYNYPLVIESLGDMVASGDRTSFDCLPDGVFQCKGHNFKKNSLTNRWELSCEITQHFKKFFKKIHTINTISNSFDCIGAQEALYEAFSIISPSRYLQNTPYLLLPQSTTWLLCYPAIALYLNTQSSLLAEACKVPHMLRHESILVDAAIFNMAWSIADDKVRHIVAISPGDTTHYVHALNAEKLEIGQMLALFWPPVRTSAVKQLLFDTITCTYDPESALVQLLNLTEKAVTFTEIIMHIVKDERIDILFTAPNGEAFSAFMRKVDEKPVVRNIQKLSATAAESYHAHYATTKQKLLDQTAELYAPLRNRYAEALAAPSTAPVA